MERWNRVLEVWINNPNESYTAIAEMAGISFTTFWKYRSNEEFMKEYHKRCQQRFKELENKAMRQLESQIDKGNFAAVKYVLDGNGYKPTDKVEVQQTTITVSVEDE